MTLTLLPQLQTEEEATVAAFTIVADAYKTALVEVPGLCDEDRACLLRQLRSAEQLAQRSPLSAAVETDPDATEVAWGRVREGYEAALAVPGLAEADRARFLRCARKAAQLAHSPLTVAGA
jgi:formiminotetrahydrofolate cyclodeaminase